MTLLLAKFHIIIYKCKQNKKTTSTMNVFCCCCCFFRMFLNYDIHLLSERTRKGHRQSDEHWNGFKSNAKDTSERRGWANMGLFQERRYRLQPNWTEPNNLCIHVVTKMCKLAPNCCVSYLDCFPVFCQQTQYINTNLNFDQCVYNYVCVSSFVRVCLCICMHIVPKGIPGICLWKDRNEALGTRQDKNAANFWQYTKDKWNTWKQFETVSLKVETTYICLRCVRTKRTQRSYLYFVFPHVKKLFVCCFEKDTFAKHLQSCCVPVKGFHY